MKLDDLILKELLLNKIFNMKIYKKTFDFYATDVELDIYVYDILTGPDYDPDTQIEVSIDRDIDHRYVTLKIFDRTLH